MDAIQDLGHLVTRLCPSGFVQARLEAELDTGFADLRLTCHMPGDRKVEASLPPVDTYKMHMDLDRIREDMARKGGGAKWRFCLFTVTSGGKFDMSVTY
jgi:hypothetical protein